MTKRILVPLDQSTPSESVLTLLASSPLVTGATVRLLNVAPVQHNVMDADGRVIAYATQETSRVEAERMEHLRRLQGELDRVTTESVVRFGEPAEEILAEAEAFGADLIVVATTCRSGVSRVALGSVAEEVLRKAKAAVVLFRPSLETGRSREAEAKAPAIQPAASVKAPRMGVATATTQICGRRVELELGETTGLGWVAVGVVTRGLAHEKGLTFKVVAPTAADAEAKVRAEIEAYLA